MRLIARLVVFIAALLLVNVTTRLVLESNVRNGAYPIGADSIGIPLMETASLSMGGAILLALLVASPSFGWLFRKAADSRPWLYAVVATLSLAYLLATAYFLFWGLSWFGGDHYPIAASCAVVVAAIVYFAAIDFRRLRPNNSFKPNPRR